ncbi:MAG: PstS family phosphate ABC transporter substrate-binding protein [Limnobacter sp.]|nr:PstS family phosphate ABC transporter substrate-binding protein [Limnobacter sp.]
MTKFPANAILTALAVTALGLSACSKNESSDGADQAVSSGDAVVQIDGSSTVFPITEAVAEDFQIEQKGEIRVTVGISGTGGGFKKFCRGETDISGASRPIKEGEMQACADAGIKFIELPVAFDALTVVINKDNDWARELTVDQLKMAWQSAAQEKIDSWNQIDPNYPDVPLRLYGPGTDSGTYDYFKEVVVGKLPDGTKDDTRADYTASEDDNVLVQGVSSDQGGLGYFGFAYYKENKDKLDAVAVVNDEGKPVLPSIETVNDGSYNPLSRPIFIYVSQASMEKPHVKKFMDYYMANAPQLSNEVGYVAMPNEYYAAASERLNTGITGKVFGVKEHKGKPIDELMTIKGAE